jgi:Cu/Ag efflux protein CusF
MKRIIVACITLVVALSLGTAVFADESIKIKGTVTKIEAATKSVTIQPKEGAAVTVIMEDAELLSKVKEGEKGQATYTVADGKNIGTKLKKMTEGCQ